MPLLVLLAPPLLPLPPPCPPCPIYLISFAPSQVRFGRDGVGGLRLTPVQVQDLERDAWNLSSSLGAERTRRLKARLGELELEPAFGSWGIWSRWEEGDWLCGLRGERHRQLIVAHGHRVAQRIEGFHARHFTG